MNEVTEKKNLIEDNILITDADVGDIPEISRVLAMSWKTEMSGLVHDEYISSIKTDKWIEPLTKGINEGRTFIYVIRSEKEIFGVAVLWTTDEEDVVNLVAFYLLPERINRGYGSMLYDYVEKEIIKRGYKKCILDVLEGNERAIRFYEKNGYYFTSKTENVVLSDCDYTCKIYEKDLRVSRYIALLRGVNVGGKNKVSMAVLKEAFEKDGFVDVNTYINSGNVLFSCDEQNIEVLQGRCREIIKNEFALDIPVAVIISEALSEALNHAPEWWDADNNSKHNAFFVIPPADAGTLIKEVGEVNKEYEKVDYYGQIIFWSAELSNFSKTKWSKYVSASGGSKITIRNANTTKKLLSLSAGEN